MAEHPGTERMVRFLSSTALETFIPSSLSLSSTASPERHVRFTSDDTLETFIPSLSSSSSTVLPERHVSFASDDSLEIFIPSSPTASLERMAQFPSTPELEAVFRSSPELQVRFASPNELETLISSSPERRVQFASTLNLESFIPASPPSSPERHVQFASAGDLVTFIRSSPERHVQFPSTPELETFSPASPERHVQFTSPENLETIIPTSCITPTTSITYPERQVRFASSPNELETVIPFSSSFPPATLLSPLGYHLEIEPTPTTLAAERASHKTDRGETGFFLRLIRSDKEKQRRIEEAKIRVGNVMADFLGREKRTVEAWDCAVVSDEEMTVGEFGEGIVGSDSESNNISDSGNDDDGDEGGVAVRTSEHGGEVMDGGAAEVEGDGEADVLSDEEEAADAEGCFGYFCVFS